MKDYSAMSIAELDEIIAEVSSARASKVDGRRAELMKELEALGGIPKGTRVAGVRTPAKPKYQSKTQADVTWTGKGMMPNWMKAEIEEGKGTAKEDFAI